MIDNENREIGADATEDRADGVTTVARTGFEAGKSDAAETAKKVYGQLSQVVGKAAYGLSYYSAFGATFALAIAREALPKTMQDGFTEGAESGREAAEKALQRMREGLSKQRETTGADSGGGAPVPDSI